MKMETEWSAETQQEQQSEREHSHHQLQMPWTGAAALENALESAEYDVICIFCVLCTEQKRLENFSFSSCE